jgi:uncharacterized protein (DUF1778 family)
MGHTSLSTTERYLGLTPERLRETVDLLDEPIVSDSTPILSKQA